MWNYTYWSKGRSRDTSSQNRHGLFQYAHNKRICFQTVKADRKSTRTLCCASLTIAPGAAENITRWILAADHVGGRRAMNGLAVSERLSGSATIWRRIAYSESRPRWHTERRQAQVSARPRSSHNNTHATDKTCCDSHTRRATGERFSMTTAASMSTLWIKLEWTAVVVVLPFALSVLVPYLSHCYMHCFKLAQEKTFHHQHTIFSKAQRENKWSQQRLPVVLQGAWS